MTIENIKIKVDAAWNQMNPSAGQIKLYQAICDKDIDAVKKSMAKTAGDTTDDTKMSQRQLLILKAIVSEGDNRDVLDAIFANSSFKNVVGEVLFHRMIDTLYTLNYKSEPTQPKVNKLSAVLEHFGKDMRFSSDTYNNGIKVDNDFVIATLRYAIRAGVSTETIQKVFSNPTFSTCGMNKAHINYLVELSYIAKGKQILAKKNGSTQSDDQKELMKTVVDLHKFLFDNELPAFTKANFVKDAIVIDSSIYPNFGSTGNALNETTNSYTIKNFTNTPSESNSTSQDNTEANDQNSAQQGSTSSHVNSKSAGDYVGIFRQIDANHLPYGIGTTYSYIKDRVYSKDMISGKLETEFKDLAADQSEIPEALLVAASAQRSIDLMMPNTEERSSEAYAYSNDFISTDYLTDIRKCVAGPMTYKGGDILVQVDLKFNSAPQLKFTLLSAIDSNVANKCDVFTGESSEDPFKNAINTYFEVAVEYQNSLHSAALAHDLGI